MEIDIEGMSVKSFTKIFNGLIKVVVVLNPRSLEIYLYIVLSKQLVILIMTKMTSEIDLYIYIGK